MKQEIEEKRDDWENISYETDEYCRKFISIMGDEAACLILESHEIESLPGYSCYVDTYRLIKHPAQTHVDYTPVFTNESKEALANIIIPAGDYKKMEWEPCGSRLTVTS